MEQRTKSRLAEQLRSEECRTDALGKLEDIDSFDTTTAEWVIEDLAFALEEESNAYVLLRLLEVLNRLARDEPRVASRATATVACTLNRSIQEYDGAGVPENREVQREVSILQAILEGTSPEETNVEVAYDDVRALVQRGEPEYRVVGYRLLGRTATGDSVRVLLRDFSHELETVREAREAALEDARSSVTPSMYSDESTSDVDTVDAFSELWAAGRIEPDSEQLDAVRQEVFAAIQRGNHGEAEKLSGAVERLAKQDEQLAETLVSKALEVTESDTGEDSVAWAVLEGCAEGAPKVVLRHAEEVVPKLEGGNPAQTRNTLKVLKSASGRVSSAPATLAEPVLELVESDNTDTAKHAIGAVRTMGFYPVPERLEELADGRRPSLSRVASQARESLQSGQSTDSVVSELRSEDAEPNLFGGDNGSVYLKTRTERGYWTDVSLGRFREGIVEETVQRIRQGESVPINYPYYEPVDVVVIALALVLQSPGSDPRVGLYSPGSRSQWGTKGEIRSKLREFALADVSGEVISAAPVPEVVPDGYVSDGRVKNNSDGTGPGQIVLTKTLTELTEVSGLDVVLLNLMSRREEEIRSDIDELEREKQDVDIVSAYSHYTRNDRDGRPRYGPPRGLESTPTVPGPDLIDPVLTQTEGNRTSSRREPNRVSNITTSVEVFGDDEWQTGDEDVRNLGRQRRIRIDQVEAEQITSLLNELFEKSATLFDTDAGGAGGLIFSRQMFFERLPIPPDAFDEWVRSRYQEGDRFVPPLIRERIGDVEQKANTVEELEAVQPLNSAKRLLDRLREEIGQHNPLFEKLKEYVAVVEKTGESLAIFSTSPKNAQLLRDKLVEIGVVDRETLKSGRISIVSPNGARRMEKHDKLLIFGSLHPENAAFYLHPRVDETVVVTYDRTRADTIERHATEFVTLLNDAVGEAGYSPYAEPETVGDLPRDDYEERERKSKTEILEVAMRSASAAAYEETANQYERELRRYLIVTDDGDRIELTNRENVLRLPSTPGENDVHWINPDSLSAGDTLVTIPDEIEEELWREHIREVYEEQLDADTALERVRTWYESLDEIRKRASEELRSEGDPTRRGLYRRLYEWINEESEDFDRVFSTVEGWFASAQEADSPMDLVQNPSLVIGPQSNRDIAAVGRAFGYDELSRDAEEIWRAMKGLRSINRREGSAYRDSIREAINSDERTRVSEAASYHEIESAERVAEDSNDGSNGKDVSDDLDTEAVQRVQDIVGLAPTSNSELCETWEYDSGSDLYQYLSSELTEYYERNEDKMIVPTEKAREVAREADGREQS